MIASNGGVLLCWPTRYSRMRHALCPLLLVMPPRSYVFALPGGGGGGGENELMYHVSLSPTARSCSWQTPAYMDGHMVACVLSRQCMLIDGNRRTDGDRTFRDLDSDVYIYTYTHTSHTHMLTRVLSPPCIVREGVTYLSTHRFLWHGSYVHLGAASYALTNVPFLGYACSQGESSLHWAECLRPTDGRKLCGCSYLPRVSRLRIYMNGYSCNAFVGTCICSAPQR